MFCRVCVDRSNSQELDSVVVSVRCVLPIKLPTSTQERDAKVRQSVIARIIHKTHEMVADMATDAGVSVSDVFYTPEYLRALIKAIA